MRAIKYPLVKFFLFMILIFLFIFTLIKSYSDYVFKNISDNFLRLHIVANSDSTKDQVVKYEIRDAILNYISPFLKDANSKQEAIEILSNNTEKLYEISYKILEDNNLNYPVTINIGKYKFPTKDYTNFILPEGTYDALKIELGNSAGQNWWCVMFPSICIIDTNNIFSSSITENDTNISLNQEELSLISKDSSTPDIKIKFKLLELFENF